MTDTQKMMKLLAWLSPVFPTGGFAYSGGLEAAVHHGLVKDETSLLGWLEAQIEFGALRNDCLFLVEAWRNARKVLDNQGVAQLADALAGSAERHLEITAQGQAFVDGLKAWEEMAVIDFPQPHILCVCVGHAAGSAQINADLALTAFAQSQISNQLQVAIRLSLLGQSGAARLLARLEPKLAQCVISAKEATLDDLGTASWQADIMAMKHQYMPARMFRS